MSKNPYEVLGVSPTATPEEIRARYVDLAKEHHPDAGDKKDDAEFIKIAHAYDILMNPERRAKYDATGVADDEITYLAVTDLQRLFTAIAEGIKDPAELGTFNLVERMHTAVRNNREQVEKGVAWLDGRLQHFNTVRLHMMQRLKKKKDEAAPDFVFAPLDRLIKDATLQRQKSENSLLVLQAIKDLLDGYDYEFTAPPPPPEPVALPPETPSTVN